MNDATITIIPIIPFDRGTHLCILWMLMQFISPFSADGITYTFGIFVVELMEAFGEGRGTVSLIPSILSGVTLGVGPIASVLVNRFGCRAVTIAGSVLAAAGLAISATTPNVSTLYVTVGLCTGMHSLWL